MAEKTLPSITRFEYQKLLGYQMDDHETVAAKVFEGKAVLADGSTRIIFGIQRPRDILIVWDFAPGQKSPRVDRNALGIKQKS